MKLTIRPRDDSVKDNRPMLPRDHRYWLDNLEITNSLTGLDLCMDAQEISTVTIRLVIDGVEHAPPKP